MTYHGRALSEIIVAATNASRMPNSTIKSINQVRFILSDCHQNNRLVFLLQHQNKYQIILAQRVGAILTVFTYHPTNSIHVIKQGLGLQSEARMVLIGQQPIESKRHGLTPYVIWRRLLLSIAY